jgi:hypothetical protein
MATVMKASRLTRLVGHNPYTATKKSEMFWIMDPIVDLLILVQFGSVWLKLMILPLVRRIRLQNILPRIKILATFTSLAR